VVLRSKVSVFIDLFHLKREAEDLAHRALHDPLTGLPNRVLFRDRLELAIARTRRLPSSVGIFYIDLDGFKPVNDTLGHEAGDVLLVELARRLRGVLRPADTVARLGGDEFAVLSDAIDGETGAAEIADRMIAVIAEPFAVGGGAAQARVSASVGIALAGDPVDPERLLREADECMYAAKAAGGNAWRLCVGGGRVTAGPIGPEFELDVVPRMGADGTAAGARSGCARPRGPPPRGGWTWTCSTARAPCASSRGADALEPGRAGRRPLGRALLSDLAARSAPRSPYAGAAPGSRWARGLGLRPGRRGPGGRPGAPDPGPGRGLGLAVRGAGSGGAALATLSRLPLEALILAPDLDDATTRATVAVAARARREGRGHRGRRRGPSRARPRARLRRRRGRGVRSGPPCARTRRAKPGQEPAWMPASPSGAVRRPPSTSGVAGLLGNANRTPGELLRRAPQPRGPRRGPSSGRSSRSPRAATPLARPVRPDVRARGHARASSGEERRPRALLAALGEDLVRQRVGPLPEARALHLRPAQLELVAE
jgi:diguanylate cyclase (GGDEF)-like protein